MKILLSLSFAVLITLIPVFSQARQTVEPIWAIDGGGLSTFSRMFVSNNENLAALDSGVGIHIFNMDTGRRTKTIARKFLSRDIYFDPSDSKLICVGNSGSVAWATYRIDLESGSEEAVRIIPSPTGSARNQSSYSPRADLLAIASGTHVRLYSASDLEVLWAYQSTGEVIVDTHVLDLHGLILAVTFDGQIIKLDINSGEEVARFRFSTTGLDLRRVHVSTDQSKFYTGFSPPGGGFPRAAIWNLPVGTLLAEAPFYGQYTRAQWNRDSSRIFTIYEGAILELRGDTGLLVGEVPSPPLSATASDIVVVRQRQAILCKTALSTYRSLPIVLPSNWTALASNLTQSGLVAITTDNLEVRVLGSNGQVRRWSIPSGIELSPVDLDPTAIGAHAISRNGSVVVTRHTGSIFRVWKIPEGQLLRTHQLTTSHIVGPVSDNGTHLAVWRSNQFFLYNNYTGETSTRTMPSTVNSMRFFSEDRELAISTGTNIQILTVPELQLIDQLSNSASMTIQAMTSTNGGVVSIVNSNHRVLRTDPLSVAHAPTFPSGLTLPCSTNEFIYYVGSWLMKYSPDDTVATAIATRPQPTGQVRDSAVSLDDRFAAVLFPGNLYLLPIQFGVSIEFEGFGGFRTVAFDINGGQLFAASNDGTIRVIDAPSGIVKQARFVTNRTISKIEVGLNNDKLLTSGGAGLEIQLPSWQFREVASGNGGALMLPKTETLGIFTPSSQIIAYNLSTGQVAYSTTSYISLGQHGLNDTRDRLLAKGGPNGRITELDSGTGAVLKTHPITPYGAFLAYLAGERFVAAMDGTWMQLFDLLHSAKIYEWVHPIPSIGDSSRTPFKISSDKRAIYNVESASVMALHAFALKRKIALLDYGIYGNPMMFELHPFKNEVAMVTSTGWLIYHRLPISIGDADFNGCTDFEDFQLVLSQLGHKGLLPSDLNGDGVVDYNDLAIVLANLGDGCP